MSTAKFAIIKNFKEDFISKLKLLPEDYRTEFLVSLTALEFYVSRTLVSGFDLEKIARDSGVSKGYALKVAIRVINKLDQEVLSCH